MNSIFHKLIQGLLNQSIYQGIDKYAPNPIIISLSNPSKPL